ncbi:thiamine pyrophosphate-binding protein [Glutamicibacter sp. PS]|uniref:thiamine pyrophosphate-binding protein n=1 Tax=Glutamicibacter sp. PS TaxID=3075634 RepID=UPI00284967E4|nr:thiamine pyrophosphate-binding protein [Glutamicibacter sp. PS]MDR4534438.1 thiamine pyrophosphate-binding protein [Glutamicibacter sp. PS]
MTDTATHTGSAAGQAPATTVGHSVMATLRSYGIDTIFGIPGTHNLELYRPLRDLGIHPVTTRHEQGAGYAADGWSQRTGLPGVVLTTSGPGLLNALSAAGTAYCESRPMLVISPGVPRGEEGSDRGALHETKDASGAAAAIMYASHRVTSGAEAVAMIHDAFELFRYGRPRPIHLEIPLDVLEGPSDSTAEQERAVPWRAYHEADPRAVARAAELLGRSTSPVILAGGGASAAPEALRELAEALDAPVVTTMNGKATLDESHPLSVGSEIRLPAAQRLANEADVLLVIGSKVGDAELWFESLRPSGTVIRIDLLASQMQVNLASDIQLQGHSQRVLRQLLDAPQLWRTPGDGAARAATARTAAREQGRQIAGGLAALAEQVAAGMPEGAILSGDSSQVTYLGTASFVPLAQPRSFLYTPAYATLGYGLPAAIGAKVADPESPVLCVLGDGALMFAVQEFMTAVEQGLDLVVVVADNGGYGEIRQNELDRAIQPVGVDLAQPDWPLLVQAFGGTGRAVREPGALAEAIEAAFVAGGLQLIHVPTGIFAG